MNEIYNYTIQSLIIVTCQIWAMSKLLKTKIDWRNKKTYLIIGFISILFAILYKISDNFVRVILMAGFLVIANQCLFNESFAKTVLSVFLVYVLFSIAEISFASIVMFFFKLDAVLYGIKFFGDFIANTIISLFVVLAMKIPIVYKKLQKVVSMSTNKVFVGIVACFGILIIALSIYSAYFRLKNSELMLIMLMYILIYMFVTFKLFYEKNERENIENKNNLLIENLSEYEKIIEIQKIEAHENKNQLRIIKGMLTDDNRELNDYIDAILKEHKKKDKDLLNQVKNIPYRSISALFYSKLVGLPQSFQVNLIVSRSVNTKNLNIISSETNVDICKILGVFLDNAIEEAIFTDDKILGMELFVENHQLNIIISNSFSNSIDLERIDEPKYSTKGINRGYGLPLVKTIIKKNEYLKNYRKINNNIFSQILVINLKKEKTK